MRVRARNGRTRINLIQVMCGLTRPATVFTRVKETAPKHMITCLVSTCLGMYRISLDIGRNRLDDTQVRLFLEAITFVLFPQRNMMGDEGRPVT